MLRPGASAYLLKAAWISNADASAFPFAYLEARSNRTGAVFRAVQCRVNSDGWILPVRSILTCVSYLRNMARFEKADTAKPAPIISSPISAIKDSGLAVFGSGSAAATVVGSAAGAAIGSAAAAGGASTTVAIATGSPVGATASTGAVFRASTGAVYSARGVASTGSFVSFANSRALVFSYTNSSPHSRPG